MYSQLIKMISERDSLQAKSLNVIVNELTEKEKNAFSSLLKYLCSKISIEEIADDYMIFVESILRETKYFVENNCEHYRYSTYNEVDELLYNNGEYMSRYMVGLQVSGYLWINHVRIHRFFADFLKETAGGKIYLEIGPGHGEYFVDAIKTDKFEEYMAIDVSETSLNMTKEYVVYHIGGGNKHISYVHGDFLLYSGKELADTIVMSEVLEHVENPRVFMKKSYEMLKPGGVLYLNVPVNAPAIDHITLFRNVDEVETIAKDSGFNVLKKSIATANDIEYEKAVRRKRAIHVVLILEKKI